MAKKALFITSNAGIEHDELIKPLEYLKSQGIETTHAAVEQQAVETVQGDKKAGPSYQPDTTLNQINPAEYDILVLAGGTVNADSLRVNKDAQTIVQAFTDQAKPIAAICHAPWLFVNAERIKDKNLTSVSTIQLDLQNAGANWVDESVHRCNTNGWVLITSRTPTDIPNFNQAIIKELAA